MCQCLHNWTWRCACLVVSLVIISITFVFGPVHTLLYMSGYKPELDTYLETEVHYAILLIYLISLSWYLFISHIFLLESTCFTSLCLLNVYIYLTLFQLAVTLAFSLFNLIYCAAVDKRCMDHRSGRTGDDIGGALGMLVLFFAYAGINAFVLSLAFNYRHVLRRLLLFYYFFFWSLYFI